MMVRSCIGLAQASARRRASVVRLGSFLPSLSLSLYRKKMSRKLAATIRRTRPVDGLMPDCCSSFGNFKFAGFLRDFDFHAVARAVCGEIDLRISDAEASNLNLVNV